MKINKLVNYAHFLKEHDYFEYSIIEDIRQKIIEDGGYPVVTENNLSIQIDGLFND